MKNLCPIWPESDIELIEVIDADDINWLYKREFDIDVAVEFTTKKISLYRNTKHDFYFFYPIKSGSNEFYKKLYKKIGYIGDKEEYLWASSFVSNGQNVLDVGCGSGNFSNYIKHANFNGIEMNRESAALARRKGLNVLSCSVQEYAKKNYRFNVVTSFQVLEHVDDPLGFFKSCADLLENNGLLIISVPNVNGFMSSRENTPLNIPPHHLTWWSLRSLIHLGNDNGLMAIDYIEEKSSSLADFTQTIFKDGFDKILNRKPSIVRTNLIDRILNYVFFSFGRLLPNSRKSIAPNGHSVTIVYKKI